MPKYNILGIGVDFPFDAYQPQLIYMEKVILSLQKNKNALLESPTGTGKTLCLLCATLAWRDDQVQKLKAAELDHGNVEYSGYTAAEPQVRDRPPQIIYASRTHSQLGQVIKELNRTSYRPKVKMCILGSRHQLCVHPTVSNQKGSNINRMCRQKVSSKMCDYHGNVQDMKGNYPEVEDIESFKEWGRAHHVCSYFLSKDQKTDADIIFMPYNYVLDPLIRKTLGLDLTGAVVILDEAHNVESVAADCGSFELTSIDFQGCVDELTKCIDTYQHDGVVLPAAIPPEAPDLAANLPIKLEEANKMLFTPKEQEAPNQQIWSMSSLKDTLMKLKSAIEAIVVPQDGLTKPGNYMYDLLRTFNITFDTKAQILHVLETAADLLANDTNLVRSFRTSALSNLSEALRKLFMDGMGPMESIAQHYKVHVQDEQRRLGPGSSAFRSATPLRRLSFWCFNAGIIMQDLAKSGVRNFILTSGTLSPLDSFAYELALDFPKECRLENPHVIDTQQIWVGAVAKATNGAKLLGTFSNRSEDYYRGLGISLANVCRIVPDGVLVFFPSYAVLDACIQSWRKEEAGKFTTWETIVKYKQPVIEPRESNQLSNAIADYEAKIKATSVDGPKGAVFFAVARGKVSEGLDFANENGRAVVIIGIPFPNSQDPRINLKKTYLNDMKSRLSSTSIPVSTGAGAISGEEWYRQSAWRAINQAVGRVIRHRLDYGAIILADERFCKDGERHLSKWLRTQVKSFQDCGPMFGSLTGFFNRLKNDPPSLQLRLPSVASSSVAVGGPPSAVRSVNESNVRNASNSVLFQSIDQGKKIEDDTAHQKSAGDSSSKTKQKMMQERSRQYLKLVSTLLNKKEYAEFKEIMKAYKEKQITVQEVMERHLVIYGVSPERENLRKDFVVFLPAENRTDWLNRVQKMMDSHKEAEERKSVDKLSANVSPAVPKPSFAEPVIPKERIDLEENIIEDDDPVNTRLAEEEDDIFEGILASSRAPAPFKPPRPSDKDSTKTPLAFDNDAAAITIEDEEDEPLPGFASASASVSKPVDASTGSSWIKSINRHRGRPNTTDADFAAADGTSAEVSPEPPNKKLKRADSIDLITGQETSKPVMTLRSPLTRALTPSQLPPIAAIPQPVLEPITPTEQVTTSSSRDCRVCRVSDELWVAPCGHAICKSCWDKILSEKLECPFCRSKVRPKKLIKLNV